LKRSPLFLLLLLGVILLIPNQARADVAPPDQPPGANLVPGNEETQVRMMAETVLLDVQASAPAGSLGQASVTAQFTMQNLGASPETMAVRFPLTFWNGLSDGFYNFPEITDLVVEVGGRVVPTNRVTTPNEIIDDQPIPWAAFEVIFPPGESIEIEVRYTAKAAGEYPHIAFRYVLETGAGWQGTIGSADLIVRLPYEASLENVLIGTQTGFSMTTPGAVLEGREVRWHYEDLEPTAEENLEISLVQPSTWEKVLGERAHVAADPQDGEAWGRLGKIYKEITRYRRSLRDDPGGVDLFEASIDAYETALALLPEDALWHAGFADLLWFRFYFEEYFSANPDHTDLQQVVEELNRAYALAPDEPFIVELIDEVRFSIPDIIGLDGEAFKFLYLTATPLLPVTETPVPASPTAPPLTVASLVPPTETRTALTATALGSAEIPTTLPSEPTPTEPAARPELQVCGGAAIFILGGVLVLKKKALWGSAGD
jgi:tetratricopeptide (TPR) repeat protein